MSVVNNRHKNEKKNHWDANLLAIFRECSFFDVYRIETFKWHFSLCMGHEMQPMEVDECL